LKECNQEVDKEILDDILDDCPVVVTCTKVFVILSYLVMLNNIHDTTPQVVS
jgi:hypothetical protein